MATLGRIVLGGDESARRQTYSPARKIITFHVATEWHPLERHLAEESSLCENPPRVAYRTTEQS